MNDDPAVSIRTRMQRMVRTIQWYRMLRAMSWGVLGLLIAGMLLALLDWWWRSEEPWLRWLLSLSFFGVSVAILLRVGLPLRSSRLTPAILAHELDQVRGKEPAGDLLAGVSLALQSPAQRRLTQQSAVLTDSIIDRTWQRVDELSKTRLVRWERLTLIITMALAAACLLLGLSMTLPSHVGVGTMRLLNPTGNYRWPSRYDLVFREFPGLIAAQQAHTLVVVDRRGRNPRSLTLEWESIENSSNRGALVSSSTDGAFTFVLPPIETDIRVRARIADSDTGWRRLQVAQAPRLASWIVTALPPACLGQPAHTLGETSLVEQGSTLSAIGEVAPPVAAAWITINTSDGQETRLPLNVSTDGTSIQTAREPEWSCKDEFTYWVEMEGIDGLRSRSKSWKMVAVSNPSPRIVWQDNELRVDDETWITIDAPWPLELEVGDEQGWSQITFELTPETESNDSPSSESEITWTTVWVQHASSSASPTEPRTRQDANQKLALILQPLELKAYSGSDRFWIRATASDLCGATSVTPRHRVRIVNQEQYGQALEGEWQRWLSDLETWGSDIEEHRRQAVLWRDNVASWNVSDARRIYASGSERVQRWIDRLAISKPSLRSQLDRIQQLHERQPIPSASLADRIRLAFAAFDDLAPRIAEQRLRYQQLLTDQPLLPPPPNPANKESSDSLAGQPLSNVEPSTSPMDVALQLEQIVLLWDELTRRIDESFRRDRLQDWPAWREALERIAQEQQSLIDQTTDWVGVSKFDIGQQKEIALLAEQQLRLSNELERFEAEVVANQSHSRRAQSLASALQSSTPSVWMRDAANRLRQQQIGAAIEAERLALRSLESLLVQGDEASQEMQQSFEENRDRALRFEMEQDLGRLARLTNELRAWRALDPSLSDASRRSAMSDRLAQLGRAMEARGITLQSDALRAEIGSQLRIAASHLSDASQAINQQDAPRAEQSLANATNALQGAASELEASINASAETSPSNSTGQEASEQDDFARQVLRWIEVEQGLIDELTGVQQPDRIAGLDLATWQAWLRVLIDSQTVLQQEINASASALDDASMPVLTWELQRLETHLTQLVSDLSQAERVDRLDSQSVSNSLAPAQQRVLQIMAQLQRLATQPPEPTVNASATNQGDALPDQDMGTTSLPPQLREEIARMRQLENSILERLDQDHPSDQDREWLDELGRDQRELANLAQLLGTAIKRAQASPSTPSQVPNAIPGLPGLPGTVLPGIPSNTQPTPSDSTERAGEDIGEERDPWEPVLVGTEEAALRLERRDASSATRQVIATVIEQLDQWLGGAPSSQPNPTSAGSVGSNTAGATSGVTQQSPTDNAQRLTPQQLSARESGVWGHLPERLRESLQRVSGDGWVQGFEDVSSSYFEKMSSDQ